MLTELRPNKELLDPNFTGYKLSLDPIPVYRQSVFEGVDHVSQSEDQYSFVHTKLFSLHNHLFSDPWHDNTVFFVDKKWQVCKATVTPETGRVEGLEIVWYIPNLDQRQAGHYNTSIQLPSVDIALVADGCGNLYVLNRSNDSNWQNQFSLGHCELSTDVTIDCGSVLVSARVSNDGSVHCVLISLQSAAPAEFPSVAEPNRPRPVSVKTVLHWLTLTRDRNGVWSVLCTRQLEGGGSVDYVAIESSCSALYVTSNANFQFTSDSANPLPPPQENEGGAEVQPVYIWQQSKDDIKVVVEVDSQMTTDLVEVKTIGKELFIQCGQNTVVQGTLLHLIDNELTMWSLQANKLEVTLSKRETGLMWTELVVGDKRGQHVVDSAVVEDVHSRLNHLCSDTEVKESGEEVAPTFNLDQLEECDIAPEDSCSLTRLDSVTHSVTHLISLGGHQWLTTVTQQPENPPSICVRHDVDGCVWKLDPPSSSPATDWPCTHIGTFAALGYVAASKQQKKFILAAPDLSYAVICEVANRVYIYRKTIHVNGELRNRRTSAKVPTVAKQQLVNLESDSPVLGAYASSNYLFVLTCDVLYTFHIQ